MALGQEWLLKVVKNLLPEDGLKVEKLSQLKMVKLESLKKSNHFKTTLKERKTHTDFFSIFAAKNTINPKTKNLIISFVMKKKNRECC